MKGEIFGSIDSTLEAVGKGSYFQVRVFFCL